MSFRSSGRLFRNGLLAMLLAGAVLKARADLPAWMQHLVGATTLEAAVYRAMDLPGVRILYPRPAKEAQSELSRLGDAEKQQPEFYSLKALTDEQALDFKVAEADWKAYAAHASDAFAAKLQLADYYHRRLQWTEEAEVLKEAASLPSPARERFVAPTLQHSWQAFDRLTRLLGEAGPGERVDQSIAAYRSWIECYPQQTVLYARLLQVELNHRDLPAAEALVAEYRRALPDEPIFPIKAAALIEYRGGSQEKALAVYDRNFQPLWPDDLVQSYLTLLAETHQQRAFVADARARLERNPDDLNAVARIFFYHRQQGQTEAAQQAIDRFRSGKDDGKSAWTPEQLYTLARLEETAQNYPEAARYEFALASLEGTAPNGEPARQAGAAALIHLLLTVPEQPIELGAGNLSLYRDIATLDRGPGYWNGILSLWLNGTSPESSFHEEELKAQPYFHRSKAAELLAQLDKSFPTAAERPALHAQIIHVYANYGEDALVVTAAKEFLAAFSKAPERTEVAGLLADAYARREETVAEFALYDSMLSELASTSSGMPLTAAQAATGTPESTTPVVEDGRTPGKKARAFELQDLPTANSAISASAVAYQQTLERYLGRLTAANKLPQALAVLRGQLDRNPGDPLLYERLAAFLQQNDLFAQQEQVYKLAIEKFQGAGWYDKLARLYLRETKREAFADLTRQVTRTFDGTGVDQYFANVSQGGPQLFLELNLYAAQRFPHDLVFTRNLLGAYRAHETANATAWEALLRSHWTEAEDLRGQFFEFLSSTGKLAGELVRLEPLAKDPDANPAAARELAEADLFSSHFEQSAPLLRSLARLYPADAEVGTRAASVFRSLAYLDPTPASTGEAVKIEENLLAADPAGTETLATLGDLHAESKSGGREDLAAAAPYWRRIPEIHPGAPEGYLEAATIFWDYFQFDDALSEIAAARGRSHDPALYGYEAGAIQEGRRDLAAAIAEYTAAALRSEAATPARTRLLQLARRAATRAQVEAATSSALAAHPGAPSLTLRAEVLVAERRESELPSLFEQALARVKTLEEAEEVAGLAQAHTLMPVYEHALVREAELSSDPVQKIELRYTLARSYESHREMANAARVMDSVYQENPRILGVVRATTDFYDRTGQPPQAIATLLEAAKAANPVLAPQFTLEAAQKANDSGNTTQGLALANDLMRLEPYNPKYLAVAAGSYAHAGDDAGLKQFYAAKLAAIKDANLSPQARKETTVTLRRGLIPALTRMKDNSGAMTQYIAILSAYPEDAGTAQEAALYAVRYRLQPQLLGFLETTVAQSPRDSRFVILLAQVQTTFEDYPAAVTAYSHAIEIRKDRADLYAGRADLEERLQRLDDAAADYQRLYVLTYKDPAWMVRLAAVRVRQHRAVDAVKALDTAWIAGRPVSAVNSFTVAAQLEQWGLLVEARTFAERGVAQSGSELLVSKDATDGPAIYARILTRLGDTEAALTTLLSAREAAELSTVSPSVLAAEAEKEGVASVTDAEWRQTFVKTRRTLAETRLQEAIDAIGSIVRSYDTPEQKVAYAQVLDVHHANAPVTEAARWIAASSSAGLLDREAAWRKQALLAVKPERTQLAPYTSLQRSRLQFADLARTLEAYAPRVKAAERASLVRQSADAWRSSGDETNELRVERGLVQGGDPATRERYLTLLLHRTPGALTALAGSKAAGLADAAANYAVEHGSPASAKAAIEARAANLPPIWKAATTSLLGLYLVGSPELATPAREAFETAIADRTIAERLATPSTDAQLTGKTWFYYAGRYGAYRTVAAGAGDAEDFLAAPLERNPASTAGYRALAAGYVDAGRLDTALAEFNHALELDADQPAVYGEMAIALWRANRKPEAVEHWRQALGALLRVENKAAPPESFWTNFGKILHDLGARALTAQLRPEIESVLTPYLSRNGNYRSNELLRAVYEASATPGDGTAWVLSLAGRAKEPSGVLYDLATAQAAPWLPAERREEILKRLIELAGSNVSDDDLASGRIVELKQMLVQLDLDQRTHAADLKAQAVFDSLDPAQRRSHSLASLAILVAARTGRLEALLAAARANPDAEATPPAQTFRSVAAILSAQGDRANAHAILEYVYDQSLLTHTLIPADFLALAEVRLETGDAAGALDLLRRLTLQPAASGEPAANFDSAARLLEAARHPTEAIPFLTRLVDEVPWNASYRLRLAKAQGLARQEGAKVHEAFLALASDASASYAVRAEAAQALEGNGPAGRSLGSVELDLLAAPHPSPEPARQPYFVAARLAAAADPANRAQAPALLREAIAIDPAASSATATLTTLLTLDAEAGRDQPALADLGALSEVRVPRNADAAVSADSGPESEVADDAVPDDSAETSEPGEASLPASITQSARPHLAELLASIYERSNDPGTGLGYLQLAIRLQADAARKALLKERYDRLRAAVELDRRNALRRPVIHAALDQPNLVRPRLTLAQLARQEAP